MTNEISQELKDKVLEMPEYRQGVNKVRIRLRDGTIYRNVFIAWGSEIVKVGDSTDFPFNARDIVEIENDL
jgi:phage-related protein